ncbi:mechanosensitive ion channel domain-containing protein [uncultured Roseovarius sp.]|uniref:mechanosensitive ion channel family protein n=1 Tax=uncultured Roseovarius sp. TaxID=293344 RepID=UPI0026138ED4|nr:mechanosensitive ion channel domain-containing protein [uncultured Roseovarius sp.]
MKHLPGYAAGRHLLLTVLLCLIASMGHSQTQEEVSTDLTAPVVVDGQTVITLSGTSSFSAEDRAAVVSQRIIEIADASESMSMNIDVIENEFGHAVNIDGAQVVIVTGPDAGREGLDDTLLTARLYSELIQESIRLYRVERTSAARQRGLIAGLLWTAVFVAFTAILVWLNRHLKTRVERLIQRKWRVVEEATQEIVRSRAIAEVVAVAVQGVLMVLYFVVLYYYVSIILFSFAETRPVATLLLNHFTDPIIEAGHAFVGFIPSLIVLLIIFFVTRYLIRIARVTFENIEAGTVRIDGFQAHWVWPSFNIIRAVLIASAIILAFPYIPGSDSAAFQGMSILLGVMVSIGSNSVVSNILAGLFVIYRRSTNVGDRIKIGGHIGEVTAIKLTETHMKSFKNELISIPNAQLLNSEVVNYSQHIDGRGLLLHTTVGIGYDEPQQKIEALLIEAARQTNGIKKSPPPFVLRSALGDFAVTYEINGFSTRGNQIPRILSDLRGNILDLLHREGIQIMSPHYENDPETPKIPEVPEPEKKPARS